jgi:excisionase family DNA binding protein
MKSRFITTGKAAQIVGVSVFTIRAEIEAGRLPAMLITTQWRVALPDLERWVQARYRGRRVSINPERGELEFHEEGTLAGV